MTAYFDNITRSISDGDLGNAINIENLVAREVSLVCGDREFPDDMREKMMETIAVWQMAPSYASTGEPIDELINENAIKYFEMLHNSRMISELHGLFHVLASRRVETRFGLLSDDPKDILNQRDHHDTVKE